MIQGLPEKLRQSRLKMGLSQRVVAKQLCVSPSIISSYETGERTPSVENLLALSSLYRCSTDQLLGREPAAPWGMISTEGLHPRQIQLLRELVDSMRK